MIVFCPACDQKYELEDTLNGRKLECQACAHKFIIQASASEPAIAEETAQKVTKPARKKINNKGVTPANTRQRSAKKKSNKGLLVGFTALLVLAGGGYMLTQQKADSTIVNNETDNEVASKEQAPAPLAKLEAMQVAEFLKPEGIAAFSTELQKQFDGQARLEKTIAEDPSKQLLLMRHELLRLCEKEDWQILFSRPIEKDFLAHFLADRPWLEEFLLSGPTDNAAEALLNLCAIWRKYPDCQREPLKRRVATAMALEGGTKRASRFIVPFNAPDRYAFFIKAYEQKKLHPDFATHPCWLMRFVVNVPKKNELLPYLLDFSEYPRDLYGRAAGNVSYITYNPFVDTIQSSMYYKPFDGKLDTDVCIEIGGVCGSLSTTGSSISSVNGIPATTTGEPAHCAYTFLKQDGQWQAGNSVDRRKRYPHRSFWVGSYTSLFLMMDVFSETEKLRQAETYGWLSGLYAKNKPQRAVGLLNQALEIQPRNYGLRRSWLQLQADNETLKDSWNDFGLQSLNALKNFPDMGWALLHEMIKFKKQLTPERSAKLWKAWLNRLASKNEERFDQFPFEDALKNYSRSMRKKPLGLLAEVLPLINKNSLMFNIAISWGQESAKSDKDKAQLLQILSDQMGSIKDEATMVSLLKKSILSAEESANAKAFNFFGNLAASKFKSPNIKAKTFTGERLSDGGIIKLSTTSRYDNPVQHPALLRLGGGSFHTNNENNPFIEVELGRQGHLSGIFIANSSGNRQRAVPLKVSVSMDGKSWNEVFSTSEVKASWNIDLAGKGILARFVRIESVQPEGKKTYLHLRNILVFGRRAQ